MLVGRDEPMQSVRANEVKLADYFVHLESNSSQLPVIPRDIWVMIGRMAGLPTMSALMMTARFFRNTFSPTQNTPGRNLPTVTLAERIGYQIRGGYDYETKKLLNRAKELNLLDSVFATKTIVPLTRTKTFEQAPLLYTVLWSLDRYMFNLLKEYIKPEMLIQQIRDYHAADCAFTQAHGKHFDFNAIIQSWEKYSNYIATFTADELKAVKENSFEEQELQRLFQAVVSESAKLPMHVINQFLNTTRSLVMNGQLVGFTEPTLIRSNSIVDMDDDTETICDSLHSKGSGFGVTYGVLRTQSKPVRANVVDALKYATMTVTVTAADGTETVKSLASVHTDALKNMRTMYLQWQANVINDALQSPLSSPKLAKA